MSSKFISEAELAEQRKIRQEEWERVRNSDQPIEAPEETYDPRSLYDRLQEQKLKKDAEYEEAHKLKNMIKGLDDDEVEFLDLIDRNKLEEERKKNLEEEKEMRDFKAAVASLQEKSLDERLKLELKKPTTSSKNTASGSGKSSQSKLLAGVVVKKSAKAENAPNMSTKRKHSDDESEKGKESAEPVEKIAKPESDPIASEIVSSDPKLTGMKCIGILPGIGDYENSSDSDNSSDSEEDIEESHGQTKAMFDMLGRKILTTANEIEKKSKETSERETS